MALRARKPEATAKRLKLFVFGEAGAGKSKAAIQFPNAYIIDCERGLDQYDKEVNANCGVVFNTSDMHEIIAEVKSLLTTKHEYRTLVIDPITTAYNDLVDKCEQKMGSDFGRHIQEANKTMKRLANLILALDMNVVVTAHAKKEYGDGLKVIGETFDGWRKLDYWFDLVIQIVRKKGEKKRIGRVTKTRIETFPDQEAFDWSYDAIKQRYDVAMLEKEAQAVQLASEAQVKELKGLLELVRLPEDTVDKWMTKAKVECFEDMPSDVIAKCIDFVKQRIPAAA